MNTKKELTLALEKARALINTEIETNGHPENIDLEQFSYNLDDMITELDFIDDFGKFDENKMGPFVGLFFIRTFTL